MDMVNSLEYWDDRFASGDWEKYEGDKQAAFFSELALQAFPDWLSKIMTNHAMTIRDYGCARGSGTALLAGHYPRCQFTGVDFSASAIAYAKEHYPNCRFELGDILTNELARCDIVFSSNTLEHMHSPLETMEKLIRSADQYAIFLLPLDDDSGHIEHFSRFTAEDLPDRLDPFFLAYFNIIDCRSGSSPFWNGKQILLVYANRLNAAIPDKLLGEICRKSILPHLDASLHYQSLLQETKQRCESLLLENQKLVHLLQTNEPLQDPAVNRLEPEAAAAKAN